MDGKPSQQEDGQANEAFENATGKHCEGVVPAARIDHFFVGVDQLVLEA